MPKKKHRQPQFLGENHEPVHRIRCAVHGFIRYSQAERNIIDHPIFRRLRYIRQLALTELIYPGATHTRFEHSLGVMEMATRIFDRLAAEQGGVMEETFKQVESLSEDTLARARQACRLAALLHDTGHCCFSHAAESVIHAGSEHEALTVKLLREPAHLQKLINDSFFPGCAELTANLIKPVAGSAAPQTQLLRDIISGQIDADRTDYLLRDSHHCGVDYGRFDHRRLIECLTLYHNEDDGSLEMAIHRDGIHSFESLILARYQMNTQVYYHRLRRIYDRYLEAYFKEQDPGNFDSPAKILGWNDVRAMHELQLAAEDQQRPGHKWASRIIHRNHHRDIFALEESDGILALKKVKSIFKKLQEQFPDKEFIEDLPEKPVTIHKLALEDDQTEGLIDFPVIDGERRSSLGGRSHVLKRLPREFRVGFIFADAYDRNERESLRSRCRELRNLT
jgi:HD superfamily phosphohydrolase